MDSEVPSIVRTVLYALRARLTSPRPRRRPAAPARILVAPHLRLGDALLITSLLAKLREQYPAAEIVLISTPPMRALYQTKPYGVTIWPYHPRRFETVAAMLARPGFDLAIIPGDNRHGWLAAALQAKWIVAHAGDRPRVKSWLIDELIEYPQSPMAMTDIFTALCPGPEPLPFSRADWPQPDFKPFNLPPAPYAVLHTGASTPLKFWPPAHWRHLAGWLAERGVTPVWSAGPGEESLTARIDPEGRYASYAGRLDLAQMWELMARAALFISPDTGVAHLARLTGVPAISLFGPGNPLLFGRGRFWRDTPCAEIAIEPFPCRDQDDVFKRRRAWIERCSRTPGQCVGKVGCMDQIGVSLVTAAIERLWARANLSPATAPKAAGG
ncbi:glycosyltransferase family 9 protein [Acidocella sp.]|uniref:glycosyltransferase family 9 protein n=1 Tax=Acidocella sp. TaxID=50710 RepID=UPI003D00006D